MFRIPDFYEMPEMTFDEAKALLKRLTMRDDLLAGLEKMNVEWDNYLNHPYMYEDDDAFFEHWQYEVNAYNVVYATMKPLFA